MANLDKWLTTMLDQGGSDLHLLVGLPPKIRVSGSLSPLAGEGPLTVERLEAALEEICPPVRWQQFQKRRDLDLAYEIEGKARFRGNFLYNHWGPAAVFRQIPARIQTLEELNLPDPLRRICSFQEGLVLVTGPTGSGKSTTLAAMINHINETQNRHLITIEDPIEFVHHNQQSVIKHREVGEHTRSFAAALRGAMRADPDIILLGEMRELETIRLALGCASMGMLVFGTLHTNSAVKTIDRIIDVFPAEEQNQIRVLLAGCLRAVVSQLLCRKAGGGRVAVHEILLPHEALPQTIRTGKLGELRTILESSSADGMITMDACLRARLQEDVIEAKEAFLKSADKAAFERYLSATDREELGLGV